MVEPAPKGLGRGDANQRMTTDGAVAATRRPRRPTTLATQDAERPATASGDQLAQPPVETGVTESTPRSADSAPCSHVRA